MHVTRKPPMKLASLVFSKEPPVPMAISACKGNRQSNWRVPSCRSHQVVGSLFSDRGALSEMADQREVATAIGELRASCNSH